METIIQIQHLQKHFGNLKVLNDVGFDIHKGEVVTIIGSSGSGKSTMLRCVNLLERMDGGHVLYHGIPLIVKYLFNSSKVALAPPRRQDTTLAPTFIVLSKRVL